MAEIVTLASPLATETLLDFIRREGSVRTDSVAYRFGWTMAKARTELKALQAQGLLDARLETIRGRRVGGTIYGWRLPDPA